MTRRRFLKLSGNALAAGSVAGCTLNQMTITDETSHRPWPLPQTPWLLRMRWHDLLFLHWPVAYDALRALIPTYLELETFDGSCWLGIVPFRMSGVRPRYVPIPMAFPELNVRTYVSFRGRSGVWFFSLDATSWLAVRAARWLGLPYYDAEMKLMLESAAVNYQSARTHKDAFPAEFVATYTPTGAVYRAAAGTLDHWLTERYCLYGALKPDHVVYGEIHHPQWPLQPARVELQRNSMTHPLGIDLPDTQPLCHFARFQEVVAWPIVPLDRIA